MQSIKLTQKEDNTFKLECDVPMIPVEIVEQTINEVASIVAKEMTHTFISTKDGEAFAHCVKQLKHYKFWNKVLYITIILICLYMLWKGLL